MRLRRLKALKQTEVYQEMLALADAKAGPVGKSMNEGRPGIGLEREVTCPCGIVTGRSPSARYHSPACRTRYERARERKRKEKERAAGAG